MDHEAYLVIAEAALLALVGGLGLVVAVVLRRRSNRRIEALLSQAPPPTPTCVLGCVQGQRILEQVQSLIAQLEPAASSGPSALLGSAGDAGVGDSIQRALEECARDWARTITNTDNATRASLAALGITLQDAQCISGRIAARSRHHYRAALTYFRNARARLTEDAAMGVYR